MKRKLVPLALILLLVAGCASFQQNWNKLTDDQKARVIINGFQDQLTNLFDTGKAYVAAKPQFQPQWKEKIVPAFDVANKAIASATSLAMTKPITPDVVYQIVQPQIQAVLNLLVQIGAIRP